MYTEINFPNTFNHFLKYPYTSKTAYTDPPRNKKADNVSELSFDKTIQSGIIMKSIFAEQILDGWLCFCWYKFIARHLEKQKPSANESKT